MTAFPGSVDPENAYVGALLHLPVDQARAAASLVRVDDLGDPQLQVIFTAIGQLIAQGTPADPAATLAHLRAGGVVTGPVAVQAIAQLLIDLHTGVAMPASAPYYARGVLDEALRRRCVEAGTRIAQATERCSLDDLVELAQGEVDAVVDLYKYRAGLP
jgi:replicative DNA helicase